MRSNFTVNTMIQRSNVYASNFVRVPGGRLILVHDLSSRSSSSARFAVPVQKFVLACKHSNTSIVRHAE